MILRIAFPDVPGEIRTTAMPHPPNTQRLLLALAIAAACALPGCQRASETIAEKAIEQASGDK